MWWEILCVLYVWVSLCARVCVSVWISNTEKMGILGENYSENNIGAEDTVRTLCRVCQARSSAELTLVPLWTSGQILCQYEASGKLEPIISFFPPPQSQLSETFLDCSGSAGESYSHVRLLATRQHRNLQPSWPELSPTDETQAYYSVQWSQMTWWSVSLLVCVCLILLVWSSSSGLVSQDCLILAFEFSVWFFNLLLLPGSSSFFCIFLFLCWHEDELVKNVLVALACGCFLQLVFIYSVFQFIQIHLITLIGPWVTGWKTADQ